MSGRGSSEKREGWLFLLGGQDRPEKRNKEGLFTVAIKGLVGETAGQVWQLLHSDGPQTLAQMKKKLKGTNQLLNFAVGWLAREDKVEIVEEKKNFRVQLK